MSTRLSKACNRCRLLRRRCSETRPCSRCMTAGAECHERARAGYTLTLWMLSRCITRLMKMQTQSCLSGHRYFHLWHKWRRVHSTRDPLRKPVQRARRRGDSTESNRWYLAYGWSCKPTWQLYCVLSGTAWFISFAHGNSTTRSIWGGHGRPQVDIHGEIWYDSFLRCCPREIVAFPPDLNTTDVLTLLFR